MKTLLFTFLLFFTTLSTFSQRLVPVLDVDDAYPFHSMDREVLAFTEWQSQLIVGGTFTSFNGQPFNKLLAWNGEHAMDLGYDGGSNSNTYVTALEATDELLYVAAKMIANDVVRSYDGTTWNQLGASFDDRITDLAFFNGMLYASCLEDNSFFFFDGLDWVLIPTPGLTEIFDMQVFENKLYLMGENASDNVVYSYDGNDLVQIAISHTVYDMEHLCATDGALYICGEFDDGATQKGVLLVSDSAASMVDFDCPKSVDSFVRHHGKNLFVEVEAGFFQLVADNRVSTPFSESENGIPPGLSAPLYVFDDKVFAAASNVKSFVRDELLSYNMDGFFEVMDGFDHQFFQTQGVKTRLSSFGTFFQNLQNNFAAFQIPSESSVSTIFSSSLWACGVANADSLASVGTFENGIDAWVFGPVSDAVDQEYSRKYCRTWMVTSQMILDHQLHYNDVGYVAPIGISDWPGNGNFSNGEAHMLAPFFDANGDSYYVPWQGDYPIIQGDRAMFIILNDQRSAYPTSNFTPMNLELHVMYYAFDDVNQNVSNTLFANVNVFNRSENDYEDFRLGVWNDWDLGFAQDDYVGCDSLSGYFFGYNGDNLDEMGTGSLGHGENPPAQGCVFLNKTMEIHTAYNGNSNPVTGDPQTKLGAFYYLHGKYMNGQNRPGGAFMYSDSPCGTEPDTEYAAGNLPGDRRSVAGTAPETLLAGEYTCFDYAYVYSRNELQNNFENACALNNEVEIIRSFYDAQGLNECALITFQEENELDQNRWDLFPNPTNSALTLVTGSHELTIENIQMYNTLGECVKSIQYSNAKPGTNISIDVNDFESGVYYLVVNSKNSTSTKKFLKNN